MTKLKYLKNFICYTVSSILIFQCIPTNIFANVQKNVRELRITSGNATSAYTVNLQWDNPPWGNTPDPDPNATNGNIQHDPEGFKISQREAINASTKFIEIKDDKTQDLKAIQLPNLSLKDGIIYEYKVEPYHTHTYNQPGTGGAAPTPITKPAPTDGDPQTVLFMTDINVSATGSGKSLNVTFDNPQFNGENIFSGYNIYFQKGGSSAQDFTSKVYVDIKSPDLKHDFDNNRGVATATYQINSNNIEQGNIYAVKVEPVVNGNEIRNPNLGTPTVTTADGIKRISFNSKAFKEYRTNDAGVSISLNILESGGQYLKLKWGDLSDLVSIGNIESISIYYGEEKDKITNLLGTIYSQDAVSVNTWRVNKPNKKTYYQLKIKIANANKVLTSEVAIYDPVSVNITPNKPIIYPKVKVEDSKSYLDLYWEKFVRPAYNAFEQGSADKDGNIIDEKIKYDVWITDSKKNLDTLGIPKILNRASPGEFDSTTIPDTKTPVYNYIAKKYVTLNDKGVFVEKDIQENKVYYIRIVAVKTVEKGPDLLSLPSDTQIYIPSKSDISNPNSLSKPPLRVKKNLLGIDMITQNDITLEWNTKWFEIYNEAKKSWEAEVIVRNGQLVFGEIPKQDDTLIKLYEYKSAEAIKNVLKSAGYADYKNALIRAIDISQSNINYEMIVKKFDDINLEGGYEVYINQLLTSQSSDWKPIVPKFNKENNTASYKVEELEKNTRYAILLRPYRILLNGKKDAYPTYILATTLPEKTNVDITPVTPVLEKVSTSDTSIEVAWKNVAKDITYKLAVNEVDTKPDDAKLIIDSDEIKKNGVVFNKNQESFIKYKINNLFPDNGYYIWVKAIFGSTNKESDWSTPIYIRTDKVQKPLPPSGIGLGSQKSLDIYNATKNTKFKPIDFDYLTLEWLRDENDNVYVSDELKTPNAEMLTLPEGSQTYLIKFNNLIANKYYYIRVKTKLYYGKNEDGQVTKVYSYVAQISLTKDFKDFTEIEVPGVTADTSNGIISESDWSATFKFKTKRTVAPDADYDGEIIENTNPLPADDFELYFDGATGTLVYRFRSDKKDGSNLSDNLSDQRFITKLINDKVFDFKLDLSSHLGYNIKNRQVQIPYSIISALTNRKISFSVVVNGVTFKLNPNFLNTDEVKNIGLDGNSYVFIDIYQNPATTPVIRYDQTYLSVPQELSVSVVKNGVKKKISFLGSDMNLDIKLNNRSEVYEKNVSIYKKNNAIWQKMNSVYNKEKGSVALKTRETTNFVAMAVGFGNNVDEVSSLNSKLILEDFVPTAINSPVSVLQFNNIVAGVANGKTKITINTPLSTKDFNSLKRSKMLLEGGVVLREAGLNSLVKLYETKTKATYKPVSDINTTEFADIKKASPQYQQSLIKAGEIGFFGDANQANPKGVMTMKELIDIINIIMDDSGF